ncbi:MAG TPA: hypothetical protein VGC21_04540 [Telluria sp.]|jgi:hypothetical protein
MEACFACSFAIALAQAVQPFSAIPSGAFRPAQAPGDAGGVVFEGQRGGQVTGAAGISQYVQLAQGRMAIHDKASGALLRPAAALAALYLTAAATGGMRACAVLHQAPVSMLYDHRGRRWIFAYRASAAPYLCLAVSAGENAAGRYYPHAIALNDGGDDPALALWDDALLLTFRMPGQGTRICGIAAGALAGTHPAMRCRTLADAGVTAASLGPGTVLKSGTPALLLALDVSAAGRGKALRLWRYDFHKNVISAPLAIQVAPFTIACAAPDAGACIAQPDGGALLPGHADALAPRVLYDGNALLLNHTVVQPDGQAALRWYEIRAPFGATQLYQQGSLAPDGDSRWMGSIGIDKTGNIAIGYAVASAGTAATIRYAGRLRTDPPGRLRQEQTIVNGSGVQSTRLGLARPAGMLALDPADGCTFWYTQQYIQSSSAAAWQSRIASFKFPQCE